MSEPEDLFHLLTVKRQERRRDQLLRSLGFLDPSADDFSLNKWTQLLNADRSDDSYQNQEFIDRKPDQLVSIVAVPNSYSELELDVESQTFRDWLSALTWDYCPVMESPFRHNIPRACSEGIIVPRWLNNETHSILERFLVIHRNGVAEFGFAKEAYYRHQEITVFKLKHIVGRIWQFVGFYSELCNRFSGELDSSNTYLVNIRGTRNTLLGDFAEGWAELRPGYPGANYPKCPDKHLQISRVTEAINSENDFETLVRWFATRIGNAWGQFEPRCYVHENIDKAKPFARSIQRR